MLGVEALGILLRALESGVFVDAIAAEQTGESRPGRRVRSEEIKAKIGLFLVFSKRHCSRCFIACSISQLCFELGLSSIKIVEQKRHIRRCAWELRGALQITDRLHRFADSTRCGGGAAIADIIGRGGFRETVVAWEILHAAL